MSTRLRTARRDSRVYPADRGFDGEFFTPRRLAVLAVIAVVTTVALLYLWVSWQAVHWLNERQAAEIELQELESDREQLRFEVAQAFSLKRIERIATTRPECLKLDPTQKHCMTMPETENGSLKYLDLNNSDHSDSDDAED